MLKFLILTILFALLLGIKSTFGQVKSTFSPDYLLVGIGTNVGNYKINHKIGDLGANLHAVQMPGFNARIDYFLGLNSKWQIGSGLEFMLFNHLFKADYTKNSKQMFRAKFLHTSQLGYEIPLYIQRLFNSRNPSKKFAITIGPRYSYFYGNPVTKTSNGLDDFSFVLNQSYKYNNGIQKGYNYSLFAEFSLFRQLVNNNWLQLSFNYTHYFVHSQLGLYTLNNSTNTIISSGEIKAYCNYVLLNLSYCFHTKQISDKP